MQETIITVPRGIEYLSDVQEIKTIYNNDLPHNAVINKGITGCGGTSLALLNDEKYVIACHLKAMMVNKASQTDRYPNILVVDGDTKHETINAYIQNGGKKIMITYDSVPKLLTNGQFNSEEWRLLVDEFQKIPSYLNSFKPSVVIKLLEGAYKFKSISYISATPTDVRWLPAPLKKLDLVTFKWEGASKPDLSHAYVNNNMPEAVLSTVLERLDNSTDEVYLFYNSRYGVATLIKRLLKCKPELKLKDIGVMFAETKDNTEFFKKQLGKDFEYSAAPNGENNKRLYAISSMGFEGLDYYPNHITNVKPTSIIVSDPNSKTMQFDINVELTQILGRFRKHKITDKFVHNKILYLWNTITTDLFKTENEYLSEVITEREEATEILTMADKNRLQKKMCIDAAKNSTSTFIILENPYEKDKSKQDVMINPYGVEAKMTLYKAVHSDAITLNNIDKDGNVMDDSAIVSNLSVISQKNISYTIPTLSAEYSKALGRTASVKRLIQEYQEICVSLYKAQELALEDEINLYYAKLDNFYINNAQFKEWLDVGITPQNMATCGMMKNAINELAESYRTLNSIKEELNNFLTVGKSYTSDQLKTIVSPYLEKSNIKVTAQAINKFVKEFYEIEDKSVWVENKAVKVKYIVEKIK